MSKRNYFTFFLLFLFINGGLWGETAVFAAPETIPVACTNGVGTTNSLASAIEQANSQTGHNIISLGQDCTYRLTHRREGSSGLPYLRDSVTIEGNGATIYRKPIKGSVTFRLLEVEPSVQVLKVALKDLTLADGSISGDGSALLMSSNNVNQHLALELDNVTVRNNYALDEGGGIYVSGFNTVVEISGSRFEDNRAGRKGGGIVFNGRNESSQLRIIKDSYFVNNEARYGGGLAAQGHIYFDSINFFDNDAATDGAGIYFSSANGLITHANFLRNIAGQFGGALYGQDSEITIGRSTLASNIAARSGGGLYHVGSISLYANKFQQNIGQLQISIGGADITIKGERDRPGRIINNVWTRNQGSRVDDLGIRDSVASQGYQIYHNTFVGRRTEATQAIWLRGPDLEFELANNIIVGYEVGVYDQSTNTFVDSNLYFDNDVDEHEVDQSQNLIAADPLFLDLENYIFLLREGSPAIDAGIELPIIDDDILREDRPKGKGYDLGAYESPWSTNLPPIANDDDYVIQQGERLIVAAPGLLANDTDPDGDELTIAYYTGPEEGRLTIAADGSFTYEPDAGFSGVSQFTYIAIDGPFDGAYDSDEATVSIEVTAEMVNTPPLAEDDAYGVAENETLQVNASDGVLDNDSDADGDVLQARLVAAPQSGNLDLDADGSFRYTPDAGFFGEDSFTYQADDGQERSNTAMVTIEVTRVNTAPVAVDDAYSVDQDGQLIVNQIDGVLANDSDADGDMLTSKFVSGTANGTFGLNDDGSFIYTPNVGFFGMDSFQYQADDGNELSNSATVTITVNRVNVSPVAEDDSYVMEQGTVLSASVLSNDGDGDGDSLTAVLLTPPNEGSLDFQADGNFTYTPVPTFQGVDSFTYLATDSVDNSESATVTIMVQEVVLNSPPVAQSDAYETAVNTPLTIAAPGVLDNDSDADGDGLTAELVSAPENGTLVLNADGSFTYEPTPDFFGNDSFRYHAHDGDLPSDAAVVTITITPPPAEPVPFQLFLPIIVRSN